MKTIKELLNFSIINIDKSSGPTSFTISDYVRRRLNDASFEITKTSHFGTLDPKVTGVLPIALGRACKLTGFFLGHDKTYVGIIHTHKEQDMGEMQKIIDKNFVGKIKQTPPKKSRVKRQERIREVKKWEILEESKDKRDFLFVAEVQGGTYIRKLCSDLGEIIGGAHMAELRRTHAGIFNEKSIVNLYDFDKAIEELKKGNERTIRKMLTSGEEAIKKILPVIQVEKTCVKQLLTGKPLFKKDIKGELPKEDIFAVFCGNRFIEISKKTKEKGIIGKAEFVFN